MDFIYQEKKIHLVWMSLTSETSVDLIDYFFLEFFFLFAFFYSNLSCLFFIANIHVHVEPKNSIIFIYCT